MKTIKCLNCEKNHSVKRYKNQKYCSLKCQNLYKRNLFIKAWLKGDESGTRPSASAHPTARPFCGHIKSYLIDKNNNKCSSCGWGEINKFTGRVPLELDHINGNRNDNRPENVRILCPNCHALTSTYRGLNVKKKPPKLIQYCECGTVISWQAKNCVKCKPIKTKIDWPPVEILLEELKSKSFVQLGKELGVLDMAIRKHLKKFNCYPTKHVLQQFKNNRGSKI
jgi:hypothetical protein